MRVLVVDDDLAMRETLRAALRLRGLLFRGERGRMYRDAAAWLGSGRVAELLEP